MDINTMINTYNTTVTDTVSEILGKECDERRNLKKNRYEAEGAKEYKLEL